jgi:hypothetical protein
MHFFQPDGLARPQMQRFARKPTAARAGLEPMEFSASITLLSPPAQVFDCLRNLRCLCDWWPGASRLQPLPPGLCGVGDCGLLLVDGEEVLLKVLAFKPGCRLILSLVLARAPLLMDLTVASVEAACRVQLQLEIPTPLNHFRQRGDALWLKLTGHRAAAALEAHLRQSPRITD